MPTGYTAKLLENPNMSLKEFALYCSGYNHPERRSIEDWIKDEKSCLEEYTTEYEEISLWDEATAEEKAAEYYNERVASHENYLRNAENEDVIYKKMAKKVENWKHSPSRVAENVKKLMLQQLDISTNGPSPFYYVKQSGAEFKKTRLEQLTRLIDGAKNSLMKAEVALSERENFFKILEELEE